MSQMAVPHDLVTVGHVLGAYGIQGWVRIKPYSADADALLNVRTWWLDKPEIRDVEMMQAKSHGGDIVARLMGVADRNAAEGLKGAVVQISRSYFPLLSDDEFYWVDLIGLEVENLQGERIGAVTDLMDNGAHPILKIATAMSQDGKTRECLIPFVEQFVRTVDQAARKITVDWNTDY
jgi:16S rRNA processing protein RimM